MTGFSRSHLKLPSSTFEHLEIEQVFAQIDFFYKKHSPELYEALTEIAQ